MGVSVISEVDNLSMGIHCMLCLHAFKRALSAPLLFPFEALVALVTMNTMKDETDFWNFWLHKFTILGVLVFAQFFISRCRIFINKAVYVLVSLMTAFKNKKQRIRNQWLCFLL